MDEEEDHEKKEESGKYEENKSENPKIIEEFEYILHKLGSDPKYMSNGEFGTLPNWTVVMLLVLYTKFKFGKDFYNCLAILLVHTRFNAPDVPLNYDQLKNWFEGLPLLSLVEIKVHH